MLNKTTIHRKRIQKVVKTEGNNINSHILRSYYSNILHDIIWKLYNISLKFYNTLLLEKKQFCYIQNNV